MRPMTPSRFWVSYGVLVLAVSAALLLLAALDPARWWYAWTATLVLVAAGTTLLTSLHAQRPLRLPEPMELRAWIAPVALTAGGSMFAHEFLGGHFGIIGALATSFGVGAVMYCQAALAEVHPHDHDTIRLINSLSIYISAFLLFAALQSIGVPNPFGALLQGVLAGLLSSELFQERHVPAWRQLLYAVLVMVLVAELAWSISFLPWGKVLTGVILLLSFYPLSGLIHYYLQARLDRWVVVEFAVVTCVALFLVYQFHGLGA